MDEYIKILEICTDIYSKDAIINATYKFTDRFYLNTEMIGNNRISVSFESKERLKIDENKIKEFYNELIDQQIRINVEKDYKMLREEIVKKAFNPINQ